MGVIARRRAAGEAGGLGSRRQAADGLLGGVEADRRRRDAAGGETTPGDPPSR